MGRTKLFCDVNPSLSTCPVFPGKDFFGSVSFLFCLEEGRENEFQCPFIPTAESNVSETNAAITRKVILTFKFKTGYF